MNENHELVGDEGTVATFNQANNGLGYPRNTDTGDSEAAPTEAPPFEVGTYVATDTADHAVER